ncbi:MAG TPA: metallophosphoesterase family protein [Thermoanaerobaculaceae bacterium]|nr:metallophosphoesterase family protein [Thermoanaerobaculaceae bacterium]HPS77435.1 metallophosphoesterase family protein [Thermoanaerobaculaceae bacterium]
MRIAVLADIHGNLPALEAVVRDLTHRGVDIVVNLGDSLSGPLLPRETAHFLIAQDWIQIAGNHERQMLTQRPAEWCPSDAHARSQLSDRELAWMESLGSTRLVADDVLLCHGTPASDTEYFLETAETTGVRMATAREVEDRLSGVNAAVVACGHTHVSRSVRSARGQLIVNPGSVGVPGYDDTVPVPHVIETGSPDARYAIIEQHGAAWSAALISVPYDHRSMARLARQRNRPDWEIALLTGYMS